MVPTHQPVTRRHIYSLTSMVHTHQQIWKKTFLSIHHGPHSQTSHKNADLQTHRHVPRPLTNLKTTDLLTSQHGPNSSTSLKKKYKLTNQHDPCSPTRHKKTDNKATSTIHESITRRKNHPQTLVAKFKVYPWTRQLVHCITCEIWRACFHTSDETKPTQRELELNHQHRPTHNNLSRPTYSFVFCSTYAELSGGEEVENRPPPPPPTKL